jgi:hypothetical protein
MTWQHLDSQMKHWSSRLVAEVKLSPEAVSCLATTIAGDIRFLPVEKKEKIKQVTPIKLEHRLDELQAFQAFMDLAGTVRDNPGVTRAQVIVQNYICFVYLPESCFRVLAKAARPGTAAKKCARFLSDNPVRAFRNAIAHGNWCYRDDYGGIIYWARNDGKNVEQLVRWEVDQENLNFWQQLARCVAYAALTNL